MNLQPNSIFAGRYRLLKQIGRGGFSVVWLVADQMTDDTEMALKIYAPDKGMDEGGLKMFRREYTVTAKLNHSGLLKASHFDIHDGSPYLVMPFCEKGSLQALLMEKGTLSEKEIACIQAQTAAALEYLHSEDILHQDIKPDNVLIDNKGNYLLTDFGISSRLRSTLRKSTNTGKAMTVAYAPPERFGAKQQSLPAGDIFSMGVMLFELSTGDVPWMGAGGAILRADSELPELPIGYDKGLEQLMQQCLRFEPSQRPAAAQLKSAAEEYLKTEQWPAAQKSRGRRKTEPIAPIPPEPPKPEASKESLLPILLGILAVVLMAGGGYWWWSSEQKKLQEERRWHYRMELDQANSSMEEMDFKKALDSYQRAQQFCEGDCIDAEKGEQAALDSLQVRLDKLVAEGDRLIQVNQFENAKAQYELASEIIPEDNVPFNRLEKLKEIESSQRYVSSLDFDVVMKELFQSKGTTNKGEAIWVPDENEQAKGYVSDDGKCYTEIMNTLKFKHQGVSHALIHFATFKYQDGEKLSCHACSAYSGLALLSRIESKGLWLIEKFEKAKWQWGSWGDAGGEELGIDFFGENLICLKIETGYLAQGVLESHISFYALNMPNRSIEKIFAYKSGYNNYGYYGPDDGSDLERQIVEKIAPKNGDTNEYYEIRMEVKETLPNDYEKVYFETYRYSNSTGKYELQ